jgi:hypothetical protein
VSIGTVTNDAGLYRVVNLLPGSYSVEVTSPGFQGFRRAGLVLQVSDIGRVDAMLDVGQANEQVTVHADASLLKTESSDVLSENVGRREQAYVPTIIRKWDSLLNLSSLTQTITQSTYGHDRVSMAGNPINMAGFYVNGQQAIHLGGKVPVYGFSHEFLQEFKAIANGFSSEFAGVEVVSLVTRNGTNEFHGSGNVYVQNKAFMATPWGLPRKLPFTENEWGFTIGGPIRKNKTHFFGGYQRVHSRQNPPAFLSITTLAQRNGDFSRTLSARGDLIPIYDPLTRRANRSTPGPQIVDPYPGDVIPAGRIDPVGFKIAGYYPAPNLPGTITGANKLRIVDENTVPSIYRVPGLTDVTGNPGSFVAFYASTINVGHTCVPTANWVLESSYSRVNYDYGSGDDGLDKNYPQQLGLKGLDTRPQLFPNTTIAGYSQIGGSNNYGFRYYQSQDSLAQRVMNYRGRHALKFGAEWVRSWEGRLGRNSFINLAFRPQPTMLATGIGNAVAALLLGLPISGGWGDIAGLNLYSYYYATYFEDVWKVRNNLTITLGLRWEIMPSAHEKDDSGKPFHSSFDRGQINPVSRTLGIITYAGVDAPLGSFPLHNSPAPRFGFAWQPWGTASKTVIRGGAGIFFKNIQGYGGYYHQLGLGNKLNGNWTSPDNGITPPFLLREGYPALGTGAAEPPGPGYGAVPVGRPPRLNVDYTDYNSYRRGYALQSNLEVQRELPGNMVMHLGYLGNQGRHVPARLQINQIPPSQFAAGNAQVRRPFPQYGDIVNTTASVYSSSYHALQVKVDKRFSHGLNFTSDYVFNKFLSNYLPWNFYDFSTAKAVQNPQHRWTSYAIYDLPWGKGRRWLNNGGALSRIFGEWAIALVITLISGSYLDVTYFTDTTNGFITGGNQGVNYLGSPANYAGADRTMPSYFNTAAFAAPEPFKFDNAGRSIIQGPATVAFDAGIHRETAVTERWRLKISAEFQNVFNHPNWLNPNTSLGSSAFGVVSGKTGNRVLQLGARVIF